MKYHSAIATITAGALLAGCSQNAVPSQPNGSTGLSPANNSAPRKHPIVAPSEIYFQEEGYMETFEVYGRKRSNESLWNVRNNCRHGKISVAFSNYNATGSVYTAQGNAPGASCYVTATNPHGKQGTVRLEVSSD